jgi:hypothetical protein
MIIYSKTIIIQFINETTLVSITLVINFKLQNIERSIDRSESMLHYSLHATHTPFVLQNCISLKCDIVLTCSHLVSLIIVYMF